MWDLPGPGIEPCAWHQPFDYQGSPHFVFFPHITKELQVHLISVYKEIPHKMDIIMMVFQMARIGRRREGREESEDGRKKEGREEKRK